MFLSKLSTRDMLVLSLLIICSIIFIGHAVSDSGNVENDIIYVKVEEEITKKEVVFKKLSLSPGDSCDYTLIFEREEVTGYDVTFKFEETEELELKNYIYVKMEAHGNVFYEKLLADAFKDGEINLHIDPAKTGGGDIHITYYLPMDVGNEAQRAKSTFKLLVTAVSQKPLDGE